MVPLALHRVEPHKKDALPQRLRPHRTAELHRQPRVDRKPVQPVQRRIERVLKERIARPVHPQPRHLPFVGNRLEVRRIRPHVAPLRVELHPHSLALHKRAHRKQCHSSPAR